MLLPKLLLLLPLALPPQPLAPYTDHKRVLLIFASAGTDPRYQEQVRLLSPHLDKLKERDLVLWPNLLHSAQEPPQGLYTPDAPHQSKEDQQALRTQFHVAPAEFTVILIGKDGGEKLRQHTPITITGLAEVIDAMPMRQDEMRHKQ